MLDRVTLSGGDETPEQTAEALKAYGLEVEIEGPDKDEEVVPAEETPAAAEEVPAPEVPAVPAVAAPADEDNDDPPEGATSDKAKGKWARRTEERNRLKQEAATERTKREDLERRLAEVTTAVRVEPKPAAAAAVTAPAPVAVAEEPAAFPDAEPKAPKFADFLDDPSGDPQTAFLAANQLYLADRSEWRSNKKAWESDQQAKLEQKRVDAAASQTEAERFETERRTKVNEMLVASRTAHPDFDLKVRTENYSLAVMAVALNPEVCENGPEVLHYLADHPELLKTINEATTGTQQHGGDTIATPVAYTRALREIAKIEATMATSKPAAASTPPAPKPATPPPAARIARPPTPVGSGGAASTASGEPDWENLDLSSKDALEKYQAARGR